MRFLDFFFRLEFLEFCSKKEPDLTAFKIRALVRVQYPSDLLTEEFDDTDEDNDDSDDDDDDSDDELTHWVIPQKEYPQHAASAAAVAAAAGASAAKAKTLSLAIQVIKHYQDLCRTKNADD